MNQDVEDQESIKLYLLNELEQEKQQQLEERLLTDNEYFEELLTAEDELIDQYLSGALSASQQERFEKHFLSTPERHQKLRFARAFRRYVAEAANTKSTTAIGSTTQAGLRRQLLPSFLHAPSSFARYSLAATLLLAIIGGSLLVVTYRRNSPNNVLETTSNSEQPFSTIRVTLTPGSVRDTGELKRIDIPSGVGNVELRLELTSDNYNTYRAVLETEGREVLTLNQLKAEATINGRVVIANIPAMLLKRGDYQLKLKAVAASGEFDDIDQYSFRILNK